MGRRGHVPQRTCTGCGGRFAKPLLVRFTVHEAKSGRELILAGSDTSGRGAYVCASLDCLERALGRKLLQRRLGATGESPGLREDFVRLIEER